MPHTKTQDAPRTTAQPPIDSASYWEWPADTELQQKQDDEIVILDLFSANHIVANLVQAASHKLSANQNEHAGESSNDDYWCMPFKKVAELDLVENDVTCAQHIENNLVKDAAAAVAARKDSVKEPSLPSQESAEYWNWPAWKEREDERVARLHHTTFFSAEHVEANLVQAAAELRVPHTPLTSAVAASDDEDYWVAF